MVGQWDSIGGGDMMALVAWGGYCLRLLGGEVAGGIESIIGGGDGMAWRDMVEILWP